MTKARRASSIIWRTVVCAAMVPACRNDAAKPKEPAPQTFAEEKEDEDEGLPSCSDFPEPDHPQRDVEVPPGDTTDGMVDILVTSEPVGAEIWIDGELAGKTPMTLRRELGGPYWMFRVSMPGYYDATMTLDLSEDRDLAVNAALISEESRPRCLDDGEHFDFGFVLN